MEPSKSCDPNIFTCAACNHKHCVLCKRDWHESLSCDEAATEDASRRREEERESKKLVGKVSKPCPGCGAKIEKDGGCINMHCEFTRSLEREDGANDHRLQVRLWILLGLHGQV